MHSLTEVDILTDPSELMQAVFHREIMVPTYMLQECSVGRIAEIPTCQTKRAKIAAVQVMYYWVNQLRWKGKERKVHDIQCRQVLREIQVRVAAFNGYK